MKKFLSKKQQERVVEFVVGVLGTFQEDGHSRECASDATRAAVSALFGVIWELNPDTYDVDAIAEFVGGVISSALTDFYGTATVGLQA